MNDAERLRVLGECVTDGCTNPQRVADPQCWACEGEATDAERDGRRLRHRRSGFERMQFNIDDNEGSDQ